MHDRFFSDVRISALKVEWNQETAAGRYIVIIADIINIITVHLTFSHIINNSKLIPSSLCKMYDGLIRLMALQLAFRCNMY